MLTILVPLAAVALNPHPLIVQRHGGWLELRLRRQEKLNALSVELVDALAEQASLAKAPDVCGVLLTAEPGRAFCAGGDIKQVAALPIPDGQKFLQAEYALMLALHELREEKPVVAIADGLVLGAGAGLFMAADTRVATMSSSFGMPECALGIVPDVGASDWLFDSSGRLPYNLGRWAALTGARLAAPIMAATGLMTHTVLGDDERQQSAALDDLRKRVFECADRKELKAALDNERIASAALSEFASGTTLRSLEAAAERTFGGGSLAELEARLTKELQSAQEVLGKQTPLERQAGAEETVVAWARDARARLSKGCPAALVVADEVSRALLSVSDPKLRRSKALGLELAVNTALGSCDDFQQGVACAVGEKKGTRPKWSHADIATAAADARVAEIIALVRSQSTEPLTV